ncbi:MULTISPECIES: hypothetical protein [unclassified Luteibacter]|uniref:hypothetical protein n=1 Tax=Luteibacter sp. PvP019 TaxID=3156436 RepID=UPI00339A3D88
MPPEEFKPLIAQRLAEGIAGFVRTSNYKRARLPPEHHSEYEVQGMMIELLIASLPSENLVVENRKILDHATLGECIPDVIVHSIGGGYWGFFELKTLLLKDSLSVAEVTKDLAKLCAYKDEHPKAAAVFVLVGSRSKLFNPQREVSWSDLKIRYDEDYFTAGRAKPQQISEKYVALPCGSYNLEGDDVISFMWEIVEAEPQGELLSTRYHFTAQMAGASTPASGNSARDTTPR